MVFLQFLFIFGMFGCLYFVVESVFNALITRRDYKTLIGYCSIYMILLGGIIGIELHLINLIPVYNWIKLIIIGVSITAIELGAGLYLNLKKGLNLWNYSTEPLNYKGQISLIRSLAWFGVAYLGLLIDSAFKLIIKG